MPEHENKHPVMPELPKPSQSENIVESGQCNNTNVASTTEYGRVLPEGLSLQPAPEKKDLTLEQVYPLFRADGAMMREREETLSPYMSPLEAAVRRRGRHSSRLLLYGLSLSCFVLIMWAAFANLEETVVGIGQVVTSQRVQRIQNLEGGIVREILVSEGDQVEKGVLLLRIDNEQAGSVHRDALTKNLELDVTLARLEAELGAAEPLYQPDVMEKAPEMVARHNALLEARRNKTATERGTLETQLDLKKLEIQELEARKKSLTESLTIAAEQLAMAKKLMETRSYSRMDYLNIAQHAAQLRGELDVLASAIPKAQAAAREVENKLALHATETRERILRERNEASAEQATLREILSAGADRVTRTEVRSPVRGVVKSINVTTEGGVIMPGEVIMDVVPMDENLIVEARISPQDRAFLFKGQKAKIRLTAYDFTIYGSLDATLEYISADTIEGRQGDIFYKVGLKTDRAFLHHGGRNLPILPGMMATADIITGKRTVLNYLVKPILKARETALRER